MDSRREGGTRRRRRSANGFVALKHLRLLVLASAFNSFGKLESMSKNPILILASMAALSGCQNLAQIPLAYTPQPHAIPDLANKTFSLDVKDVRLYVTSGAKTTSYLGIAYSGLFVLHHDVFNASKVALEKQLEGDLRKELEALGLVDSPAAGAKRIVVRVREFYGDTFLKRRFTYDVELAVFNAAGKQLAIHQAKGQKTFSAKFMDSNDSPLRRQIPIYYDEIIQELVRGDPLVLLALGNDL